jgi:thiamine-monophosphate kinase
MQLAVSSDMLVEGRHFLSTVAPSRLGHKALAVNLSDLAACGARPVAFTLALALPQADAVWLEQFAKGLFSLADAQGCELVGGDTTRGPLNICITVFGEVPTGQALLRGGARAGDDLWVSGTVGDARLALEVFRGTLGVSAEVFDKARVRMELPTPRLALGMALRGLATSAIDISDGLLGDLGHVLRASGVGASVDVSVAAGLLATPVHAVSPAVTARRLEFALAGGDDYELLFTAPAQQRAAVLATAVKTQTPLTRIGHIEAGSGVRLVDAQGHLVSAAFASFDHFKT